MKVKKGDKVKIMCGKDKDRNGVVEKVYLKQNKILISNINIYKKHIKKNEKMPKGGVIELPRPIEVSKIMLICPKCAKTTRIGIQINSNKKTRFCKKCKTKI